MGDYEGFETLRPDFVDIDTLNAHELKEQYDKVSKEASVLLIDMSLVHYVDSSGLGAILSIVRETIGQGNQIAICAAQPSVSVLFRMVKLAKLLPIFETLEEGRSWAAGEISK